MPHNGSFSTSFKRYLLAPQRYVFAMQPFRCLRQNWQSEWNYSIFSPCVPVCVACPSFGIKWMTWYSPALTYRLAPFRTSIGKCCHAPDPLWFWMMHHLWYSSGPISSRSTKSRQGRQTKKAVLLHCTWMTIIRFFSISVKKSGLISRTQDQFGTIGNLKWHRRSTKEYS